MKRWWWAAALVAAAIVAIATIETAPQGEGGRTDASAMDAGRSALFSSDQTRGARAPAAAPPPAGADTAATLAGGTLPVAHPATEADGFIEVRVSAIGKPLAGAQVTLYARGDFGGDSRGAGQLRGFMARFQRLPPRAEADDFRLAFAGETGADGVVRLPARPGLYLISARSGALAPARKEQLRPAGERVTRVSLELTAPLSLSGRTVAKQGREPVPLAEIVLVPGNAPLAEEAHATADSSGRFRFDGLAPGQYRAEASAPGYARATREVEVPGDEVTLLLAASSFIEGVVVDAQGRPAGGAQVTATGAPELVVASATDSGSFSLEVEPRTYRLAAQRGDEAGALEAPVSAVAGATARGVKITLGASAGIAGTVVAQQPTPGLAQGSRAVAQPVAGAVVDVSPHGSDGSSGRAETDATGSFAVTGLAPGSYDVEVSADGFGKELRRGVTVAAGQRFPLRVELRGTGAVEGVVRDAGGRAVAGALVLDGTAASARTDESGAYLLPGLVAGLRLISARRDGAAGGASQLADIRAGAAARVDFTLRDEGVLAGHVIGKGARAAVVLAVLMPRALSAATIPVDGDGAYSASLAEGSYGVSAAPEAGGPRSRREFISIAAGRTVQLDLTLPADGDPAAGFSGSVLEPDGTPSVHARVVGRGNGHFAFIFAETDEAGSFQSGRPRSELPDAFTLTAQIGGRKGTVQVAAAQAEAVVQLLPGATLRGHVTTSGAAIDSFTISVGGESLEFAGDRFELRDLPGDETHVSVTTRDGRSGHADAMLAPGGTGEVEVALVEDAVLLGRVIDADTRAPLANALVPSGYSGADGRFRCANLPPGESTAVIRLDGYQPFQKKVTLLSGAPLDLGDVLLSRTRAAPGTIGIQVRGDSDGVTVSLVIEGSPAEHAGVRLGDTILAVDGAAVNGPDDARNRIRGAPGAPVLLTVLRNGSERLVLPVVRAG